MGLIVIGVVILGIGLHFYRRSRTPSGAEPLPGRVVDVKVKRSSQSNSNTLLYAATVSYRDPRTGREEVLPPASHQPRALEVGDEVTLMRDPATGQVRMPLPNPGLQMALPFGFGVGVIAFGIADLMS